MYSWTPRPHFNRINPDICLISETYFLKAFCSSGFRIKKLSFFFAPFLIVGGVQLEADAENEDVADDVADDDDDED